MRLKHDTYRSNNYVNSEFYNIFYTAPLYC